MTMARSASWAVSCLRVGWQGAVPLRSTTIRHYSAVPSRSELVKSIKMHWNNWLDQTRPVAMERFRELSQQWNTVSGYEAIQKHKDQVDKECT